ncbi:MAG: hypothetical protein E6R08_10160 [Nevskiaceae bacterium]|nr:MAG: hypothetical protein E6R08_10160 [Nevskiaceae bacterium]
MTSSPVEAAAIGGGWPAPGQGTLFVAPGATPAARLCNIYLMPYPMRPGQRPSDLQPSFQRAWRLVGAMRPDYREGCLKVLWLSPSFAAFAEDLEAVGAGGYITVPFVTSRS